MPIRRQCQDGRRLLKAALKHLKGPVGLALQLSPKVLAHLGLQELVQYWLEQCCHTAVALKQILDLLVVYSNLNSGYR